MELNTSRLGPRTSERRADLDASSIRLQQEVSKVASVSESKLMQTKSDLCRQSSDKDRSSLQLCSLYFRLSYAD